jgi:hypothetical protein
MEDVTDSWLSLWQFTTTDKRPVKKIPKRFFLITGISNSMGLGNTVS